MIRAILLLLVTGVLLNEQLAAGTFAWLKPGVSTKTDVDRVLGAPLHEVLTGTRYDYDPGKYKARRISVAFHPETQVVQTIDLYLAEAYSRANYVEWFELSAADRVAYDAYGNRVEMYAAKAISLHFDGPAEDGQVLFFRHYSPDLTFGGPPPLGAQSAKASGASPAPPSRPQPHLGVFLSQYEGQGYRVLDVEGQSPARKAGIQGGDIILELEQLTFYQSKLDPKMFARFVATMPEDKPLRMLVQRGNRRIEVHPVLELRDPNVAQARTRRLAINYYNEGATLADRGKCKQAIPLLEKATLYNPKDAKALEMLGYCQFRRGHKEESFQSVQRALKLAPGSPMANYFVAAHYEEMNHKDKAILHYGLYLANDDGDKFRQKYARKHLGQLTGSRSSANWDKAMGMFLMILQQEVANGSFGTDSQQSETLQNALNMVRQQGASSGQQQQGVKVDRVWEMYEAIRQEMSSQQE